MKHMLDWTIHTTAMGSPCGAVFFANIRKSSDDVAIKRGFSFLLGLNKAIQLLKMQLGKLMRRAYAILCV